MNQNFSVQQEPICNDEKVGRFLVVLWPVLKETLLNKAQVEKRFSKAVVANQPKLTDLCETSGW